MENPKLFISYSWSSPEHEQWVLQLATELVDSGIDVILDKWDLKEGHDAYAFMEKMVTDPEITKVIMVCDRKYSEKADGRSGGVGTETQIISKEVYEKTDQNKFVAIVTKKDENGKAYLPTYYKSRIYIDLSDDDLYAKNFEQLLRWIYDKPLYIKPEPGKKPSFLSEPNAVSLGTSAKFKRALDAIRNNKEYASGALNEYFEALVSGLEKFRISNYKGEFDEKVVESIEQFIPYRNEAIEVFLALAQYRNTMETTRQLHRFFEQLIPYFYVPEGVNSWIEWNFDNLKFIVQELFLYCISAFLKYDCFNAVGYLLRHHFYIERHSEYGINVMQSFGIFRNYLGSLEYRNKRLQLRRSSLHADLLKQRCTAIGFAFDKLMQADFVLFLRDSIDALREGKCQLWWPETLVYKSYRGGTFEIFSRAESAEFFNELKSIFDIKDKDELKPLLSAFNEGKLHIPKCQFDSLHPNEVMGFDKLATRP
jgi:hypothetical protein